MGIFDKAKDALGDHSDKVDQGIDRVSDYADERTDNKYSDQIDGGAETIKDRVSDSLGAADDDENGDVSIPAPMVPGQQTGT